MHFEHMIKAALLYLYTTQYLSIAHIYNGISYIIRVQTVQLHDGPGHSLIRFLNSHMDKEFLISVGNIFQTWAPKYWKDFNPLLVDFLIGWISLLLSLTP